MEKINESMNENGRRCLLWRDHYVAGKKPVGFTVIPHNVGNMQIVNLVPMQQVTFF